MRQPILTLIITLFSFALFAQDLGREKNPVSHLDGGANKILDEISDKYKKYSTIEIDYTYKVEKNGKILNNIKGSMVIKGDKYYLLFDNQEYYCDGATIWSYQKEVNEISIFDYEEDSDFALNPAKILNNWKKKFRAKFIREEDENGKRVVLIDITPIEEEAFYKIRIFMDKNKNEFVRFAIYERDNTTSTYSFDKFLVNRDIDDEKFELNRTSYPNAEINDMR